MRETLQPALSFLLISSAWVYAAMRLVIITLNSMLLKDGAY